MTPENFTYWLNGYLEIENPKYISEENLQIIRDHLSLVFNKVTPDRTVNRSLGFDILSTKHSGLTAEPLC